MYTLISPAVRGAAARRNGRWSPPCRRAFPSQHRCTCPKTCNFIPCTIALRHTHALSRCFHFSNHQANCHFYGFPHANCRNFAKIVNGSSMGAFIRAPRANLSSNAAVAAERPRRYRCAISSTTHQSRGIGGSTWHPWAPCSLYLEHQAPRRSEGQQRLAEHTGIPGSADQQMRMA